MPAEIVFPFPTTGLTTLTARLRTGATVVGPAITLSDTASAGVYLGDVPGGTADGNYDVVAYNGATVVGVSSGTLFWRSGAEVPLATTGAAMTLTPAERTSIAAAVWGATTRTLSSFGTLIADLWANATRTLTADPGAAAHATTQAGIALVKAKTDLLPAAPAAVGDIPTAATIASAVRTNLATELGRVDVAISTRESEASAATRAATDQTEHDTTQTAIAAIAALGDPLARPVPGTYPAGSAGEALGKLVIGPPDEPAIVIPGAPAEADMCRVYGYTETVANIKRSGVEVVFTLVVPTNLATASERLIADRKVKMCSDAQGRLLGPTGDPWVDLQRNDLLETASGTTHYLVSSRHLGIEDKQITLTTPVVNLRDILVA